MRIPRNTIRMIIIGHDPNSHVRSYSQLEDDQAQIPSHMKRIVLMMYVGDTGLNSSNRKQKRSNRWFIVALVALKGYM